MKIGVLASPHSWYLHDLRRAAGAQHELIALPFSALTARVGTHEPPCSSTVHCANHSLSQFDAILVRSMPPGSLEQVVFRMNALHQASAEGCLVLNPPRCLEVAIDKYLTSALLSAAGLRIPRTMVSQTFEQAMIDFESLGRDVVIKPIFGGEGRGITRLQDEAIADRVFRTLTQLGHVIYQQEFIHHEGYDCRVLLLGCDRLHGMRRVSRLDWRTNISRGAAAEPLELDDQLIDLARRSAAAVDVPLAGVDILPGRDGHLYVLEVNAVPGWRGLSAACQIDVAAEILDWMERHRS